MSETELHVGTLRRVTLRGLGFTLEDNIQALFESFGLDKEGYDTWKEAFWGGDKFYHYCRGKNLTYVIVHGVLYYAKEKKMEPEECLLATTNSDGSIDYTVCFYNGDCDLEEALQAAVDKEKAHEVV